MNGIQPIHFTDFNPPSSEPLLRTHSLVVWVLNIITMGIYGSAECLEKRYRIKELKLQQADVQQQVRELLKEWANIESKVAKIARSAERLDGRDQQKIEKCQKTLDSKIKPDLEQEFARLKAKVIKTNEIYVARLSQIVLDTISFVGLLLANALTAGFYSVYQYNQLNNQIKLLTGQNDFIRETAGILNEEKQSAVEQQLDLVSKSLELMGEKYNPEHEEASQAFEEAKQAQQELEKWRNKQRQAQRDLGALQTDLVKYQNAEQKANQEYTNVVAPEVNRLRADNQQLAADKNAVKAERDRLKAEKDVRDQDIAKLRRQVNAIKPVQTAQELQRQANKLKSKYNKLPQEQKLQKQLGPVPPKYTKRIDDQDCIIGAICTVGEDADKDKIKAFDEKKRAAFKAYENRYHAAKIEHFDAATRQIIVDDPSTHRTAASLVEAGFDYVFEQITAQADKFKLTKSSQTKDSAGAKTVYRAIMLDLLSGAKLHAPTCHGYELRINGDVNMYPSHAEKVMQYEKDDRGVLKAGVAVSYQRKDDFTPTPARFKKEHGVDPVGAKWILEQLSDEEKDILYHLLMAPVMENTHADYQAAVEFIGNKEDPRVKLVKTAYELISDLAEAIEIQFKDDVLAQCWKKHANDDAVQPFEKEDDVQVIEEPELDQEEEVKTPKIRIGDTDERVSWAIKSDILGNKQGGRHTQAEFTKLIESAQAKHEGAFSVLSDELLRFTHEKEETFEWLEWEDIRNQYCVSKQHVPGHNDVFINLLATLCTEKKDLTEDNVRKLKKAMAAFLDDPQHANAFAQLIQEKYNLPVAEYKSWLRGNNPRPLDKVGPIEIQLAAYTLGIRIGVLSVEEAGEAEIDRCGKIVPKEDYYGPNTEIILLMAKHQNNFYGLFPKLKLEDNPVIDNWIDMGLMDFVTNLSDIYSYWKDIDTSSHKDLNSSGIDDAKKVAYKPIDEEDIE